MASKPHANDILPTPFSFVAGIPYDRFKSLAAAAPRDFSDSQQMILGVDRLDYTKGLVNRIRAVERLLEKHPEYINKVTFLQVSSTFCH